MIKIALYLERVYEYYEIVPAERKEYELKNNSI